MADEQDTPLRDLEPAPAVPDAPDSDLVKRTPAPAMGRALRRQLERQAELLECETKLKALLEEYNATFDVIETITYRNGQAIHTHAARIISQ